MRIRGLGRLPLMARRMRNRVRPGTLVLLYHRIVTLESDPLLLSVEPQNFEQHLEVLKRIANTNSLGALVVELQEKKVPRQSVVITFDDGTVDNLSNARPILERHDTPATVFVVSGCAGQAKELWWSELEHLILSPGKLPECLSLKTNGTHFRWQLNSSANYSHADAQRHRGWNVLSKRDDTERQRLYRALLDLLRSVEIPTRDRTLKQLREWSGVTSRPDPARAVLNHAQIRELAKDGLVEIGAHTVNHPVLALLPRESQRQEIIQNRDELSETIGHPIRSFAYPYGTRSDYTRETVDIVRAAGFACACSNFTGVVDPSSDLFQIPRFVVRNWDGDEFERHLKDWFRE